MNKKIVLSVLSMFFLAAFSIFAQEPISWNFSIEDAGSGEVDIVAKATVDQGWYMYDTEIPEGGPNPTMIEFDEITGGELVGKFKASDKKAVVKFDEIFQMEIGSFTNTVTFKQRIKVTDKANFAAVGNVRAQACNDATCTPPLPVDFEFGANSLPTTVTVSSTADASTTTASGTIDNSSIAENSTDATNLSLTDAEMAAAAASNLQPVDSDILWTPVIGELQALSDGDDLADASLIDIFLKGLL